MIERIDVSEKLGLNKFNVNEGSPHIIIDKDNKDERALDMLIRACPAALYDRSKDGRIQFDYAGCLECGTCKVLCEGTIVEKWNYPEGTFGIEYRIG